LEIKIVQNVISEHKLEKLLTILAEYEEKRIKCIPLVASENQSSFFVRNLLQSDICNRYYIADSEPDASAWNYPNQKLLKELLRYTTNLALEIFNAGSVSLSPLSGNQCVAGVLMGLTKAGDNVMGISSEHGGHWALSELAAKLGVNTHFVPFDEKRCEIDLNKLRKVVAQVKPVFLMLDASHTLFPYPVEEIRKELGPDIKIFYDVSHIFGLIAGGALKNPLEVGATCIHGSTHKSFFGPQKGILAFNSNGDICSRIEHALHPILASNIHLHHIAALAGALEEIKFHGKEYSGQVVKNAKHLAGCLSHLGITVPFTERGFTETHQVWIPYEKEKAEENFRTFQECGILLNLVQLPFKLGTGFRVGTAEITRLGYSLEDIESISSFLADVLLDKSEVKNIKHKVEEITSKNKHIKFALPEKQSKSFEKLMMSLRR
jgi:glycine/serine hydroxymethyltransferase